MGVPYSKTHRYDTGSEETKMISVASCRMGCKRTHVDNDTATVGYSNTKTKVLSAVNLASTPVVV
jgi:hypothetical protein